MYEIRKNGTLIVLTDELNYIRMHPNGFYILCDKNQAQGVAVNGVPYALGEGTLGECEPVIIVKRDSGRILQDQNIANSIAFVTLAEAGSIDTVTAEEHVELFAPWAYPADYKTGNLRRYNGRLYKCIGDHTSQADWAPDVAVSLWVPTSDPAEEYPAWSQPVGAHDAYNTGDKVSHNGKHWTSDVDSNVWEPGVYGWTEVTA